MKNNMHEIYHSDHLGSSTYLTDNFGRPSHYYETLPFGEMIVEHNQSTYYKSPYPTTNTGDYDNAYKFNGKELDEATGMYYYGARYYDPRISIFVSVDPLAEKGPQYTPYNFSFNNPINLVDPNGEWPYPSSVVQKFQALGHQIDTGIKKAAYYLSAPLRALKVEVGASAGVGLGFKATKYATGRADLSLGGAKGSIDNKGISVDGYGLKLQGKLSVGDKGGLNLQGSLTGAQVDFSNVQNIIKLESPNFDKFSFLNAEGKAQFMELFESSGSAWAVQNNKGSWSFLDGSTELNMKKDVFEKSDIAGEVKLGLKVSVGVSLTELFKKYDDRDK